MKPGKTWWLLKIHPDSQIWEPQYTIYDYFSKKISSLALLSINIIFHFFSSLTMLGKFPIFHLVFIIIYISLT